MPEQRMVLCTLATGRHQELLEIGRPALERYAVRHGYDLVVRTDAPGLGGRGPGWGKVPLIHGLLDHYDVVVWIDADAVIVDPTDDIAATPSWRPMDVVSHRIGGVLIPNLGVIVTRRGPRARWLLERTWHRTEYIDHHWWENAALIATVGGNGDAGLTTRWSRWRARLELGPLDPRWNSIPVDPHPNPAIVHLAGMAHDERLTTMADLVAGAEGQSRPSMMRMSRSAPPSSTLSASW